MGELLFQYSCIQSDLSIEDRSSRMYDGLISKIPNNNNAHERPIQLGST